MVHYLIKVRSEHEVFSQGLRHEHSKCFQKEPSLWPRFVCSNTNENYCYVDYQKMLQLSLFDLSANIILKQNNFTYLSSLASWLVVMIGIVLGVDLPLAVVSPPYNHVNNNCLIKILSKNGILFAQSLQRGLIVLKHQHNLSEPALRKFHFSKVQVKN